jgi:hypothetical protein
MQFARQSMMSNAKPNLSLTSRASWLIVAKTAAFVFGFALPLLLVRRLSLTILVFTSRRSWLSARSLESCHWALPPAPFISCHENARKVASIALNIILFNSLVGSFAVVLFLLAPRSLVLILNSQSLVPYAGHIGLLILLLILEVFLEVASIANGERDSQPFSSSRLKS